MLRTMPIRMISTMTIMMTSGTARTRKTTGKRIADQQQVIITGPQRGLSTLQAGYIGFIMFFSCFLIFPIYIN